MLALRPDGSELGIHRVKKPGGVLPQAAEILDNSLPIFDNELLIKVENLQIDSASFHNLKSSNIPVQEQVLQIVRQRGKMHNPVTNSGGVCFGRIEEIGPKSPFQNDFKKGDAVVTLVSLTLTPLAINSISAVDRKKERVMVDGHAILFASGILAKIPSDLSQGVTMATLDVCGAPAQVKRLVPTGAKVLVIGLGKAGRFSALQAQINGAQVWGIDPVKESVVWCQKNLKGHFDVCDATNPVGVHDWCLKEGRRPFDWVINTANVGGTEMSSILATRQGGNVLLFGMNTSFQRATLGAEGVARDVNLIMGNGYVPGHADLALNLVRHHEFLKKWLEDCYA